MLHVLATALGALVAMTVMLVEALGYFETLTAFRALELVIWHWLPSCYRVPGRAIIDQPAAGVS